MKTGSFGKDPIRELKMENVIVTLNQKTPKDKSRSRLDTGEDCIHELDNYAKKNSTMQHNEKLECVKRKFRSTEDWFSYSYICLMQIPERENKEQF